MFPMRGMKRPKVPKHRLNVHYASARLEKKQWKSKLIKNQPKRPQLKASEIYIPIMIYLRRLISQISKACKCPDIKSRRVLLSC